MINKIPFNEKKVQEQAQKLAIWNNIYHARKYRWYSQSQLAELISSSQKYISEIENWEKNFWVTMLISLSKALTISPNLLWEVTTNWKLIEFFDYLLKKLWKIDWFLMANKLCYFTELESLKQQNQKFLWLTMQRYYRWPFSKEIYIIREIFNTERYFNTQAEREIEKIYNSNQFKTYTILTDNELKFIDSIIEKYWTLSATELENLTYKTTPMKKINAKKWDTSTLHTILF